MFRGVCAWNLLMKEWMRIQAETPHKHAHFSQIKYNALAFKKKNETLMHVCMSTHTHCAVRQTNQLPSGVLACQKGQRALLFSLWFSYYTEINTVELFCHTQGLWTHRQWALDSFIALSLSLSLSGPLSFYFTASLIDAHDVAHSFKLCQTNK